MSQPSVATNQDFVSLGLSPDVAGELSTALEIGLAEGEPNAAWRRICADILRPEHPFDVHLRAHAAVFANWDASKRPAPVWVPDLESIAQTNLAALMRDRGLDSYGALFKWSIEDRFGFWQEMLETLHIRFVQNPERLVADKTDVESPDWLHGATLNIADSCFNADQQSIAIVYAKEDGLLCEMTLAELEAMTNRVANGLVELGLTPGDAVAIDMLMTVESVAIYLGIVKAGCVAVSIADSFAAEELATRLRIANAKAIFTQDVILRGGKRLPLYEKVMQAEAPKAVVLPIGDELSVELRQIDCTWSNFLSDNEVFESVSRNPHDHSNILFSSGTTGDPKAIPWTHTTPIKCAADGWLHHDIREGDLVAWPTNLGWMMGPWLIYASLVNGASIVLYEGAPNTRKFCEFVADAQVTMLGVVPSLVKAWRTNGSVDDLDWSSIRCFSSTGECSNAEDMFWLMSRAGYKPVIEYCGGTEIGGGYITGTMVQPAVPAMFTTPAMGLDLAIVDEQGNAAPCGELYLIGPSIGLSNELINRDHHEVYFQGTPTGPGGEMLRRHGDEMCQLSGGYFQAQGRADDTMNLGGIKTSSAEIERAVNETPGVQETAAIAAAPPGGGPDLLILFVVAEPGTTIDPGQIQPVMQQAIKQHLNPLFRIHEVRPVPSLPRTASNKVMRRLLRADYQSSG